MEPELLPCPFCAGTNLSYGSFCVWCRDCGGEGRKIGYTSFAPNRYATHEELATAWNRRASRTAPATGEDRVECVDCDGVGSWARCPAVHPSGQRCNKRASQQHRYHVGDSHGWPEPAIVPPGTAAPVCERGGESVCSCAKHVLGTGGATACERCGGTGAITGWIEAHPYQEGCPDCRGEGVVARTPPTPGRTP